MNANGMEVSSWYMNIYYYVKFMNKPSRYLTDKILNI